MNNQGIINGVETQMKNLMQKQINAIDSLCIDMVNWIKDNHETLGGWQNITHALENSITSVPAEIEGNDVIGYVGSSLKGGQIYAPFVEYKPGHWVLSGAMREYAPKLLSLIKQKIKEQG